MHKLGGRTGGVSGGDRQFCGESEIRIFCSPVFFSRISVLLRPYGEKKLFFSRQLDTYEQSRFSLPFYFFLTMGRKCCTRFAPPPLKPENTTPKPENTPSLPELRCRLHFTTLSDGCRLVLVAHTYYTRCENTSYIHGRAIITLY